MLGISARYTNISGGWDVHRGTLTAIDELRDCHEVQSRRRQSCKPCVVMGDGGGACICVLLYLLAQKQVDDEADSG